MSTDQITIVIDGIVMGVDVTLLVHFGGRIWDDYQERRVIRRHAAAADARRTAHADARQARLDALVGGDEE